MPTQIDIMIDFKTQVTAFFDELIAQFPQEGDLVVMRLYIATQMDIAEAMNTFMLELNTNNGYSREAIKVRNEMYFLKYDINPNTNNKYKLSHFKSLWRSGQLDAEDKGVIWSWLDIFVILVDKYKSSISST